MKLLELFDRIYYCVFSFIMKSPSRDMPHVMSAIVIALVIGMHTIMLLAFIESRAGIQIAFENAKIIIVLLSILLFSLTAYYYVWKKNGERIIKHYKEKMNARVSAIIGYVIFFETIFLPIIIGIIFFHRK